MADGLLMAYGLRRLNFQQHGSKAARPKASCDLTKNHGLNSGSGLRALNEGERP
jgi:hypothetical protein